MREDIKEFRQAIEAVRSSDSVNLSEDVVHALDTARNCIENLSADLERLVADVIELQRRARQ